MSKKLVYIIMGQMGSGKTVLSKQIKQKLGNNTKIFEDYSFILESKPEAKLELLTIISKARHIDQKIIVVAHRVRSLGSRFDFRKNDLLVWIFTSLSVEEFSILKDMGINTNYLHKLHKAWINCMTKKRKTRPYLSMTLNKNRTSIDYEYHRYRLENKK